MEKIKKDGITKKALYSLCAIAFALLYALLVFLFEPIYVSLESDIAVSGFLTSVLYYACVAIELLAVFSCYSVAIYGIYKFGKKSVRGLILIFVAAALLKYFCKTAVNWSYEGALPLLWYMDLIDAVYFAALELLQFIIVWAVISRALSGAVAAGDGKITFSRLYDKQNPLMCAALRASVTVVAARIFLSLVDDALAIVMYGMPEKIETVILMVISYVSTLILGVICYIITVFVLSRFCDVDAKES